MTVEHYIAGRRVYTVGEASDILHTPPATIRQRLKRSGTTAAGWINPREPVYYPADLGLPESVTGDS